MPPKKTKPNQKCPCGSGKKHKKYCMVAGQLAASVVAAAAASSSAPPTTTTTTVYDEAMERLAFTTAMDELALTTITSKTSDSSRPCCHGNTSNHFRDGVAYRDVIYKYLSLPDRAGREKFEQEHRDCLDDIQFAHYCFALCTSRYLKTNTAVVEMIWLLYLAIDIKYLLVPTIAQFKWWSGTRS